MGILKMKGVGAKNIGIEVKKPEVSCSDRNCPFHGKISLRGRIFTGKVVSNRMDKTAIVLINYVKKIRKYERYERRRSRIPAHNPVCISAEIGDQVKIAESRPISKTKAFVIIEKVRE
jgi:small subunit ribosomal protein S17